MVRTTAMDVVKKKKRRIYKVYNTCTDSTTVDALQNQVKIPQKCTTSVELQKEDFDCNRLRTLLYSISSKFCSVRMLLLKKDPSNASSLLISFLPSFISSDSMSNILNAITPVRIKCITIQRTTDPAGDLKQGYRTILVNLDSELDVDNILKLCESTLPIRLSDIGIKLLPCGPRVYSEEYRNAYLPPNELQNQVDSYIAEFDAQTREQKSTAKRMRNVPDEDGWITVTRSHYKRAPPAIVVKDKVDLLNLMKKKKKPGNKVAFYSFQIKDSKKQYLKELRQKFEEDKKKLAIAKAARKFRPT